MDARGIVREAFFSEYRRLGGTTQIAIVESGAMVRQYQLSNEQLVEILEQHFDLENVSQELLQERRRIVTAQKRERRDRYHRTNLHQLARMFAGYLHEASEEQGVLTEEALAEAERLLRMSGPCRAYPCRRRR